MPDLVKNAALDLIDSLKTAGMTDRESHKVLGISRACLGVGVALGTGVAWRGAYGGPQAAALGFTAGMLVGTTACEAVQRMPTKMLDDLRETIARM